MCSKILDCINVRGLAFLSVLTLFAASGIAETTTSELQSKEEALIEREKALELREHRLAEREKRLLDNNAVVLPRSVYGMVNVAPLSGSALSGRFVELSAMPSADVDRINRMLAKYHARLLSERVKAMRIVEQSSSKAVIKIAQFAEIGRQIRETLLTELKGSLPEEAFELFSVTARNNVDQTFANFGQFNETVAIEPSGNADIFIVTLESRNADGHVERMQVTEMSKDQILHRLGSAVNELEVLAAAR